jgi:hypothetical protein
MFRILTKNKIVKFDSLVEAIEFRNNNGGTLYQWVFSSN